MGDTRAHAIRISAGSAESSAGAWEATVGPASPAAAEDLGVDMFK